MKIYLASRYDRRPELQLYREFLLSEGHTVTSRWIDGNHHINDTLWPEETKVAAFQKFADEDCEDLSASDMVLSFTDPPGPSTSLGGRHVEFGLALKTKRCVVIGPRENVFHYLPEVEWYPDFSSFCISFLNKNILTKYICDCGFEFSIHTDNENENATNAHKICVCGKKMREKKEVTK